MKKTNPTIFSNGVYQQGSLDSLCGVYSVINAINAMAGKKFSAEKCFINMIETLGSDTVSAMLIGTTAAQLSKMLKVCAVCVAEDGMELSFSRASWGASDGLATYWGRLKDHYEDHGNGSIIVGLWGEHHHWTCVKKISDRSMMLYDSGRLKRIDRSRSTVVTPTLSRPHLILPHHSFLLELKY